MKNFFSKNSFILIAWAIILQIALIFGLYLSNYYVVSQSVEARLALRPVDPTDLFRGDYMALEYDINTISTYSNNDDFRVGDEVYVPLRNDYAYMVDNVLRFSETGITKTKPENNKNGLYDESTVYIKGRIEAVSSGRYNGFRSSSSSSKRSSSSKSSSKSSSRSRSSSSNLRSTSNSSSSKSSSSTRSLDEYDLCGENGCPKVGEYYNSSSSSYSSYSYDDYGYSSGRTYRIKYGIEQYFIEKGAGNNLNLRWNNAYGIVKINENGEARLDRLEIDGKNWP